MPGGFSPVSAQLQIDFSYIPYIKRWNYSWSPVVHKSYLTLLAWLLMQDKKSMQHNSIFLLLSAMAFTKLDKSGVNSQRIFLNLVRFKINTNKNYISIDFDSDLFTFDVIPELRHIRNMHNVTRVKAWYQVTLPVEG